MRIMMVLDAVFPPDIRVEKEVESLAAAGHEVHVVCYRHSRAMEKKTTWKGGLIHRHWVPRQVARKALGLIFLIPLYLQLWRFLLARSLDEIRPDAVHVHDLPLGLPVLQVLDRMGHDRPFFVLDLHENYPDMARNSSLGQGIPQRWVFDLEKWIRLERLLVNRADHLLVVSPENETRLRTEHHTEVSITVVPNTARREEFSASAPTAWTRSFFASDSFNLLYVGGLDPTRGLETVLHGLARAGTLRQALNLVVVGAGPLWDKLESLARLLGIDQQVRFAGQVPQGQVGEFCQCADLCLLPLKRTPQTEHASPNKLYQYIYWGKPVLAAGTDSLTRSMEELGCGRTYIPDDPNSFAEVLRDLMSDQVALARLGKQGRRRFLEQYNWEKTVQPLIDLYAQMVHRV